MQFKTNSCLGRIIENTSIKNNPAEGLFFLFIENQNLYY